MIIDDEEITYRRRRSGASEYEERGTDIVRDVASCKLSAGLVPCHMVTFHLGTVFNSISIKIANNLTIKSSISILMPVMWKINFSFFVRLASKHKIFQLICTF